MILSSIIALYYISENMKVLIIGANGFLGRNLVRKCLDLGWDVDCVYNNEKKFIPKKCKSYHIDDLEKIKDSYSAIFLLSAFIPQDKSVISDERLLEVNINIPLRVVRKFKKSKIIFSSSTLVYGIHNSIISENSSFNSPNSYALSKLAGEYIVSFTANYQIVRFPSIYGNGMNTKTFIPKLLEQAKQKKKITLFGNGSRLQNYLYIEDAVGYLLSAMSQEQPGIYLGVYGKSYSNTEVARIIQKVITGCNINYEGEDNSPSFIYNNSITKQLLGFNPIYNLETGIGSTIKNG